MGSVSVRPVSGREEKVFLRLPEDLYRGDPHWVPPLWLAEADRLIGVLARDMANLRRSFGTSPATKPERLEVPADRGRPAGG